MNDNNINTEMFVVCFLLLTQKMTSFYRTRENKGMFDNLSLKSLWNNKFLTVS